MGKRKASSGPVQQTILVIGGERFAFPAVPYCDCKHPIWAGSTRRGDGVWVRPCCMRRTKHMYEKYGDSPVPPSRSK